ncbi:hypothetical protein HK104_011316 [Borealophlyctis nickersoniae]|nr:hypothetical protein HK104_011316 [Borealophlyctis nickersoniae]
MASPKAATRRHAIERREQQIRQKEFVREDLIKQLNQDAVFRKNLDSDDRVENKRRLRNQQTRQEELRTQETFIETARRRMERELMLRKEEELVKEVERIRHEQLREEKLRQSIRENSVELRELEKKLNYAYMNKERALQKQQKEVQVEQDKAKEAELIADMNRRVEIEKQRELEKEREAYERGVLYHQALHEQLAEHEARKEAEFEQFLREKAMVDEIVRRIMMEDEREARRRLEKQQETKQFIEDFMTEREDWRRKEKMRQEAENRKIEEYARLQLQREEEQQQQKKKADDEKNIIYDKLAAEMERQEREKAELEQLRIELYQQEQEDAARRRDQASFPDYGIRFSTASIRKRLELIDAYREQILQKRFRAMQEREAEEEFRQKMMAKYAEDERIEQLNAQKRRMKQLEHKRAVDALVEQRRLLLKEEYERMMEVEKREGELEQYRQEVIEQERQRLLREHAANLLGYLPKGVLRDDKDLELFDEEFRRKFEGLAV